jgi:hypothetical protein
MHTNFQIEGHLIIQIKIPRLKAPSLMLAHLRMILIQMIPNRMETML